MSPYLVGYTGFNPKSNFSLQSVHISVNMVLPLASIVLTVHTTTVFRLQCPHLTALSSMSSLLTTSIYASAVSVVPILLGVGRGVNVTNVMSNVIIPNVTNVILTAGQERVKWRHE